MNEKAKREMPKKSIFSRIAFFLLWVVFSIGITANFPPVYQWFMQFIGVTSFADLRFELLGALIFALASLPVEKILLRLGFGIWVKGWIRAGLLGTALATLLNIYVNSGENFNNLGLWRESTNRLYLLLWSAILVLPQSFILRKYGKRVWLFFGFATLSNFLANIVFRLLLNIGLESSSLAIGASAVVMALGLILMFRQTPTVEKTKVDEASARLEDKIADEAEIDESDESERKSSLREAIYAFYKWLRNALHNPSLEKSIS